MATRLTNFKNQIAAKKLSDLEQIPACGLRFFICEVWSPDWWIKKGCPSFHILILHVCVRVCVKWPNLINNKITRLCLLFSDSALALEGPTNTPTLLLYGPNHSLASSPLGRGVPFKEPNFPLTNFYEYCRNIFCLFQWKTRALPIRLSYSTAHCLQAIMQGSVNSKQLMNNGCPCQ